MFFDSFCRLGSVVWIAECGKSEKSLTAGAEADTGCSDNLKLVEKIVEKSGVKPDNADLLKQAREALDGFNTNIVYGDVDANGTVEATDALWALQAYVGSRQLDEKAFKAADVNLDKEVNTSDALAILQYAVKLRDKLPIA